jgi:hypothetical protein
MATADGSKCTRTMSTHGCRFPGLFLCLEAYTKSGPFTSLQPLAYLQLVWVCSNGGRGSWDGSELVTYVAADNWLRAAGLVLSSSQGLTTRETPRSTSLYPFHPSLLLFKRDPSTLLACSVFKPAGRPVVGDWCNWVWHG